MNEFLLVRWGCPVTQGDFDQLVEILRAADCIRSATGDGVGHFSGVPYIESVMQERQTHIYVDRNVFKWILSLQRGTKTPVGLQSRNAAALMAVSIALDIQLDPAIAVIEGPAGTDEWISQLAEFRALDNVHPRNFTDIALGRTACVDAEELASVRTKLGEPREQFSTLKPSGWIINYICIFKIATLILAAKPKDPGIEDMKRLIRWSHDEFIFSAAAITFGNFALSRRFGKMIKGLSDDYQSASRGLANATWDLALLRFWASKVMKSQDRGPVELLCSFDRAVLECGKYLIGGESDTCLLLESLFTRAWGKEAARELVDLHATAFADLENPSRKINRYPKEKFAEIVSAMQRDLEGELRTFFELG